MVKLYSKFPNSSKLFFKIPKSIKLIIIMGRVSIKTCAKVHAHFSIKTYLFCYKKKKNLFFYFTYSLFKMPPIKLFTLHNISLKYQFFFLCFFNCFSFFTKLVLLV